MVLEVGGSRPLAHPEMCRRPLQGVGAEYAQRGMQKWGHDASRGSSSSPGASSGIGEAVARVLAAQGDTVALVARRAGPPRCRAGRLPGHLARLRALGRRPLGPGGRGRTWPCPSGTTSTGIDVVINNAGAPMRRHATELTMAEVERTMTTNYFSPVAITLALLPRMLARRSGTIVNVSSLGGRLGIATEAAYSGSKFALAGWSEALAMDLDGTGVRVKLILPGAIDTEIWDQPGNDAAALRRPQGPPVGDRPGHRRRPRQRGVRALPPRHESGGRDEDVRHRRASWSACAP